MKRYYPAVIETGPEPGYSVFFPDFDGCVSADDTIEKTIKGAREALAGHIQLMIEDEEDIPAPTNLDDLKLDKDIQVEVIVLIEANIPGQKQRYNVTLDSALVEEIDRRSNNRSGFLEQAAREKLAHDNHA